MPARAGRGVGRKGFVNEVLVYLTMWCCVWVSRMRLAARVRDAAVDRRRASLRVALAGACVCLALTVGCAPEYRGRPYGDADSGPATMDRLSRLVPVPGPALLSPQPEPDCPALARRDNDASLTQRMMLEFERECYRQAEMRARERLRRLQGSVAGTIKAIKRLEQAARQQSALSAQ